MTNYDTSHWWIDPCGDILALTPNGGYEVICSMIPHIDGRGIVSWPHETIERARIIARAPRMETALRAIAKIAPDQDGSIRITPDLMSLVKDGLINR